MPKDPYAVYPTEEREDAEARGKAGYVVVYNAGIAIREVDEDGHSLPVGHYGCLPRGNSILEGLVDSGLLELVEGNAGSTKRKASPQKKAAAKAESAEDGADSVQSEAEGES
tara:strand:+ start:226 stop:561 length:336 start_codon:yes stop_codon:yes gene_type:complete